MADRCTAQTGSSWNLHDCRQPVKDGGTLCPRHLAGRRRSEHARKIRDRCVYLGHDGNEYAACEQEHTHRLYVGMKPVNLGAFQFRNPQAAFNLCDQHSDELKAMVAADDRFVLQWDFPNRSAEK